MPKIENLEGQYNLKANILTNNEGLKLLIAKRSTATKTKTPTFLIDKTTNQGNYISSLYPLDTDYFKFDYQGKYYQIRLFRNEGLAEIQPFIKINFNGK